MPPKAKNKAKTPSQKLNNSSTEQDEVLIQETEETEGESNMSSPTKWRENLEDLIDSHFRQLSDLLTDMMKRHFKLYKQEIDEIKKSQDFISTNFDHVIKSIKKLKEQNMELREENENLRTKVDKLDNNIIANEQEVENLKQYRQRDMLDFYGIQVLEDEATNEIVLKVGHLVDPEHLLQDDDISISHRLPSREGTIPPIIVKFCRRNMREN